MRRLLLALLRCFPRAGGWRSLEPNKANRGFPTSDELDAQDGKSRTIALSATTQIKAATSKI